ncbi:hypothetical protein [Pedococcus sp. 5OH_020]|uniref:hypothetical protein n=1 Tax=Pedococcus sp. 5OH_020 TaxID=2989814 RepID=UPI0022E9A850|nr:hypothetical protein [Pedococcus sp. 5OH_020]
MTHMTQFVPYMDQTRRLGVGHSAALLEERLYDPRLSLNEVVQAYRVARDTQLAAVVSTHPIALAQRRP